MPGLYEQYLRDTYLGDEDFPEDDESFEEPVLAERQHSDPLVAFDGTRLRPLTDLDANVRFLFPYSSFNVVQRLDSARALMRRR